MTSQSADDFRLTVLNPGGRDPEQDFGDASGPDGGGHPPINFHGLRHTWASHTVMNGVPMLVVAKNLGHSDTRMVEKHYGHLAPSFVADAIRAGAPRFGGAADEKILPFVTAT